MGEVIHIDDFGNVITNVTFEDARSIGLNFGDKTKIKIKIISLKPPSISLPFLKDLLSEGFLDLHSTLLRESFLPL